MILTPNPAWEIKDSSKLDDWCACRRQYFYRHILGWRPAVPAHDLYFGECWHLAREYGLLNGYDDVQGAFNAFNDHYRLEFPQETDELYKPKTPGAVLAALMTLAISPYYSRDLDDNEIVEINGNKMTEISGTVPISSTRSLHYRMDSIMRRKEDGMIFSWDHKTTTEKYINYDNWTNQFYLSIQNGTYTHCLYCMFPIEQVLGVEFYGVGFVYLSRGSANRSAGYHATFKKAPVYKTPEQMNTWLWNVNRLCDDIDYEMQLLDQCKEGDDVMTAFPMNPKSCTSYRGCPYFDFCMSFQNPLQRCGEPPTGFETSFWRPDEKASKNIMNLNFGG
jgi:hypothetical protein